MTFKFKNKNININGGSRGNWGVTAGFFCEGGAKVIITYTSNATAANETLSAFKGPGRHSAYQLNVADPDAVKSFFEAYAKDYDKLDVLVNNAGIFNEHK